ncbi:hypothetical protein F0562_013781 [Nyssa sinensis]|uniref:MADS-box domain-containing protein n=1 Tax=Nyssa sinensis TaxID=561372 RepID=A0A5J4ZLP3_9ASTE|nr:hypothetical protein F0562_013781 [Nyssa sinensis]
MKNSEKKPMGMGCPKLEIKKIEKKSKLQVTFSKRRADLFNKVAQLSAMCGAVVAVLVMSPAKKAVGKLETEKKQEKAVEESKAAAGCGFWWDESIDGIGLDELEQYMASLEVVKKKVRTRAEEIAMISASSSNFLPPGGVAM